MEWRLYEGRGESIYFIGIEDDGSPFGLTKRNMAESLFTLKKMATVLQFTLTVTTLWTVIKNGESLYICKCKVKGGKSSFNNIHNVNIKVIGLSNSGKSSLICCLKSPDVYDDGDGSARTAVMSHDYEFESGNTASVKLVPIYFNEDGCIISSHLIGDSNLSLTPKVDEKDPYKVTYLHDNPGYLRYTRTSFNGLCRVNSVIDMIVIDINANPDQIIDSLELFCFSYYLGHRPIVVLNKSDTKTKSKDTICCKIKKLTEVYMSKRICTVVHSIREADAVAESFNVSKKYIPIFEVSCVTRGNLHLIHRFLFKLAPESFFKKKLTLEQTLFSINSLIKSDKGLIVEGDMLGGKITATSNLKIGPMNDSSFLEVKALSIMRNSESINSIEKQQNGAICLEIDRKYWPSIRKGMVIVEREKDLRVFKAFSSK
ncbi:MAG: GTP binding protein, partial [Paramarteilia canceri]